MFVHIDSAEAGGVKGVFRPGSTLVGVLGGMDRGVRTALCVDDVDPTAGDDVEDVGVVWCRVAVASVARVFNTLLSWTVVEALDSESMTNEMSLQIQNKTIKVSSLQVPKQRNNPTTNVGSILHTPKC